MKLSHKHIVLIVLFFTSTLAFGQKHKSKNQARFDFKPVHFGFNIGLNYSTFQIQPIENFNTLTDIKSIEIGVNPGYHVGPIVDFRMGNYFNLRFNPRFAATQRDLIFTVTNPLDPSLPDVQVLRQVQSSSAEFPIRLKYKSTRIHNYRMFLSAGIKYSKDFTSQENVDDDEIFKIKSNDLAYELGFGFDIYFDYFKFSPEIRASFGFADLRVDDDTDFSNAIDKIYTRGIFITFNFE